MCRYAIAGAGERTGNGIWRASQRCSNRCYSFLVNMAPNENLARTRLKAAYDLRKQDAKLISNCRISKAMPKSIPALGAGNPTILQALRKCRFAMGPLLNGRNFVFCVILRAGSEIGLRIQAPFCPDFVFPQVTQPTCSKALRYIFREIVSERVRPCMLEGQRVNVVHL